MGAVDSLIGGARITRHADRTDRCGHRHRARFGRHDVVANAGQKPLGGDIDVLDAAVFQDQPELVARKAAEHVAAAQPCANPPGDIGDHCVRHVETEGVVDARQMIDADQHEAEG